ncbi:AIPR family protein [Thermobifida halotolerans]|uniref:AIPR family protein n=1 Tax=Thermobifida halotolerans TaxID=483545 RepID=A0A399FVH0_9ACTN|nr:AIPR family protein [Thermobifida halotolerans]UOE18852.1 AIPR family protein [Thermobifida halotolerans]
MQGASVEEFAISLEQAVDDRLNEESGLHKRDVFVQVVSEYLIEDGTLEDLYVCYYVHPYGRSRVEVSGYAISDDGHVLDLVVADYGNYGQTVSRDQVRKRFRWAELFAEACRDGHHREMDESTPEFDMAQKIHSQWSDFDKIRIFLLTDGRSTFDNLPQSELGGIPVVQDLWDIERIRRLATSGRHEEPISVDFTELGGPLPCLPASTGEDDYQCLLTVIPGQVLADMYELYGAKLLQRNVRSFLQLRGKVNKGINETIRTAPERFLAYNNGISATATGVEFDGEKTRIVRLDDLQIVNGGQTTASLHHAAKRSRADLSRIWVTAKITVVRAGLLDELVPNISRYANSQNTINEADFEANSPFHVELERASRRVWAPAVAGGTRQSRWYYERARGQYDVDKSRRPTAAQKRAFAAEYPRQQRFTKTDAAKYEMTFRQAPHVVSLGAQKCFQRWTSEVVSNFTGVPDDEYFRKLVAKRILFEGARSEINRLNPKAGYLANVTTYTLARLVEDIDLEKVFALTWKQQEVPAEVIRAVQELSGPVRRVLLAAPGAGNVTEWCKKEDCWKSVLDIRWGGPSPTIARQQKK